MPRNYGLIADLDTFGAFVQQLTSADEPIELGFDIESGYDGADREGGALHMYDPDWKLVGFSFSADPSWARYVPVGHDSGPNLDPVAVAPLLVDLLTKTRTVVHNLSFERPGLRRFFTDFIPQHPWVQSTGGWFDGYADTMLQSYLLADTQSHGLKYLSKELLGVEQAELVSLFDLPKNRQKMLRFNALELTPAVIDYACDDAALCLELHRMMYPRVKDHPLYAVEMTIMEILGEMEHWGIYFDWGAMAEVTARAVEFFPRFEAEIQAELGYLTGQPERLVNLNSPPQLAKVLYDELGLPVGRRSKKSGNASTDALTMSVLAGIHPVVGRIVEWKTLYKLINTYLTKYERNFSYAADGRVHASHAQAIVPSGRFAVNSPNYQQLPKKYHYDLSAAAQAHAEQRDPEPGDCFAFNFRRFVAAPAGMYMFGFDFSQVELRVLAGVSGEPALLEAFNSDLDIHSTTAAMMFKLPIEQVTHELRAKGKTLGFGLVYGLEVKGLAERLGTTVDEAQALYDQYFATFTKIKAWTEQQVRFGSDHGFVYTPFGRKVTLWELQSPQRWIREKGERLCVNAPIQGGAADYMKIAMVRVRAALREAGYGAKVQLVMNNHDALDFYVDRSVWPSELISLLDPAVSFAVPFLPRIRADWHYGANWGSMTEILVDEQGRLVHKETGETYTDAEFLAEQPVPVAPAPSRPRPPVPAPPAHLSWIITLSAMPTESQATALWELLREHPGPDSLIILTPGGVIDQLHTSLTLEDVPKLTSVCPGALLTLDPGSAGSLDLLSDLDL